MIKELVAETLGTSILFLAILITGEPLYIVLALLTAIYTFGKVSGGHFNGTTSFILFVKGAIDTKTFVSYVIAQMIGALIALFTWKYLFVSDAKKEK